MNNKAKPYEYLQNSMQITIELDETEDSEVAKNVILEQIRQITGVKQATYFGSGTPASFSGMLTSIRFINDTMNMERVDEMVKTFLDNNKSLLISAYKMRDSGTEQRYALALKEDNEANRDVFLDFMLEHNDTEIGKDFPTSFRFVRAELIKKAGGLEPIITEPKAA
jgi:hypothetical protein